MRQALPADAFVITDQNLARHYPDFLEGLPHLVLEPGEETKSFAHLERCLKWLVAQGADRGSSVVAFGGGVVGDLAGFAAASYMRGVSLVQVPTTLLAQVDSSVGGKVGIDLPEGKNLVGAFHPPQAVHIPLETLKSLPERQFVNGTAEVWKYAFIMEPGLLLRPITPEDPELQRIVAECVRLKAEVVGEDEFEKTGRRAILNFGHTVGHAIEQVTGYRTYLHGEAVAIGMVVEARLGELAGVTQAGTSRQVETALAAQGLPVRLKENFEPGFLLEAMTRDKKAGRGRLAFSLLEEIGRCKLVSDVPRDLVERAMLG